MSRLTTAGARFAFLATVAVAATVVACADFDAPAPVVLPDLLVSTPSYARDIQPIFTNRCATASCHNFATHQFNQNLDSLHSYSDLVNHSSIIGGPAFLRVKPGRPDSSWLVRMIVAGPDSSVRNGAPRMPLGRSPLTDNQIANIVTWITQGAPRN